MANDPIEAWQEQYLQQQQDKEERQLQGLSRAIQQEQERQAFDEVYRTQDLSTPESYPGADDPYADRGWFTRELMAGVQDLGTAKDFVDLGLAQLFGDEQDVYQAADDLRASQIKAEQMASPEVKPLTQWEDAGDVLRGIAGNIARSAPFMAVGGVGGGATVLGGGALSRAGGFLANKLGQRAVGQALSTTGRALMTRAGAKVGAGLGLGVASTAENSYEVTDPERRAAWEAAIREQRRQQAWSSPENLVRIVHVQDGDTVKVVDSQGNIKWIRLADANTADAGQAGKQAATEYLQRLIDEGKPVAFVQTGPSSHNRLVGHLYREGDPESLNEQLLSAGLAVPHSNVATQEEYRRRALENLLSGKVLYGNRFTDQPVTPNAVYTQAQAFTGKPDVTLGEILTTTSLVSGIQGGLELLPWMHGFKRIGNRFAEGMKRAVQDPLTKRMLTSGLIGGAEETGTELAQQVLQHMNEAYLDRTGYELTPERKQEYLDTLVAAPIGFLFGAVGGIPAPIRRGKKPQEERAVPPETTLALPQRVTGEAYPEGEVPAQPPENPVNLVQDALDKTEFEGIDQLLTPELRDELGPEQSQEVAWKLQRITDETEVNTVGQLARILKENANPDAEAVRSALDKFDKQALDLVKELGIDPGSETISKNYVENLLPNIQRKAYKLMGTEAYRQKGLDLLSTYYKLKTVVDARDTFKDSTPYFFGPKDIEARGLEQGNDFEAQLDKQLAESLDEEGQQVLAEFGSIGDVTQDYRAKEMEEKLSQMRQWSAPFRATSPKGKELQKYSDVFEFSSVWDQLVAERGEQGAMEAARSAYMNMDPASRKRYAQEKGVDTAVYTDDLAKAHLQDLWMYRLKEPEAMRRADQGEGVKLMERAEMGQYSRPVEQVTREGSKVRQAAQETLDAIAAKNVQGAIKGLRKLAGKLSSRQADNKFRTRIPYRAPDGTLKVFDLSEYLADQGVGDYQLATLGSGVKKIQGQEAVRQRALEAVGALLASTDPEAQAVGKALLQLGGSLGKQKGRGEQFMVAVKGAEIPLDDLLTGGLPSNLATPSEYERPLVEEMGKSLVDSPNKLDTEPREYQYDTLMPPGGKFHKTDLPLGEKGRLKGLSPQLRSRLFENLNKLEAALIEKLLKMEPASEVRQELHTKWQKLKSGKKSKEHYKKQRNELRKLIDKRVAEISPSQLKSLRDNYYRTREWLELGSTLTREEIDNARNLLDGARNAKTANVQEEYVAQFDKQVRPFLPEEGKKALEELSTDNLEARERLLQKMERASVDYQKAEPFLVEEPVTVSSREKAPEEKVLEALAQKLPGISFVLGRTNELKLLHEGFAGELPSALHELWKAPKEVVQVTLTKETAHSLGSAKDAVLTLFKAEANKKHKRITQGNLVTSLSKEEWQRKYEQVKQRLKKPKLTLKKKTSNTLQKEVNQFIKQSRKELQRVMPGRLDAVLIDGKAFEKTPDKVGKAIVRDGKIKIFINPKLAKTNQQQIAAFLHETGHLIWLNLKETLSKEETQSIKKAYQQYKKQGGTKSKEEWLADQIGRASVKYLSSVSHFRRALGKIKVAVQAFAKVIRGVVDKILGYEGQDIPDVAERLAEKVFVDRILKQGAYKDVKPKRNYTYYISKDEMKKAIEYYESLEEGFREEAPREAPKKEPKQEKPREKQKTDQDAVKKAVNEAVKRVEHLPKDVQKLVKKITKAAFGKTEASPEVASMLANMMTSQNVNERQTALMAAYHTILSPQDRALLNQAFDSSYVRRQVEKLLDEATWEEVKDDPAQMLAVSFEMWQAGDIELGNKLQRLYQLLKQFLGNIFGVVTKQEQALQILQGLSKASHQLAEKIANTDLQLYQDTYLRKNAFQKWFSYAHEMTSMMGKTTKKIVLPTHSLLLATNNPAVRKILRGFFSDWDDPEAATFDENVQAMNGILQTLMVDILGNKDDSFLQRWGYAMRTGIEPTDPELKEAVDKTREFFDNLYLYLSEAGVNIGKIKKGFFPRVWDPVYIESHADEFTDFLLTYTDVNSKEEAQTIVERIIQEEGVYEPDLQYDYALSMGSTMERPIQYKVQGKRGEPGQGKGGAKKPDLVEIEKIAEKFKQKDALQSIIAYTHAAVRKAEFSRKWGVDGAKLQKLLKEADYHGFTDEKARKSLYQWIDAQLGFPASHINPALQNTLGWLIVAMNYSILGGITMASTPDLLTPMLASRGDKRAMRKAYATLFKDGYRWVRRQPKDTQLELLDHLGTVENKMFSEIMNLRAGSTFLNSVQRKFNDVFFEAVGIAGLTRSIRRALTASAIEFLESNRDNKQYLKELGLKEGDLQFDEEGHLVLPTAKEQFDLLNKIKDEIEEKSLITNLLAKIKDREERLERNPEDTQAKEDLQRFKNALRKHGGKKRIQELDKKMAPIKKEIRKLERVRSAIVKYVNRGSIRPNPGTRPVWMNDPRFMLFGYLKDFLYGAHEVYWRQTKHLAETYGMSSKELREAVYMLALFGPAYLLGEAIRDTIQHGPDDEDPGKLGWTAYDHLRNAYIRSGLFGIMETGFDIQESTQRGHAFYRDLLGPFYARLEDGIEALASDDSGSVERYFSKWFPLQSMWKDWAFELPGDATENEGWLEAYGF